MMFPQQQWDTREPSPTTGPGTSRNETAFPCHKTQHGGGIPYEPQELKPTRKRSEQWHQQTKQGNEHYASFPFFLAIASSTALSCFRSSSLRETTVFFGLTTAVVAAGGLVVGALGAVFTVAGSMVRGFTLAVCCFWGTVIAFIGDPLANEDDEDDADGGAAWGTVMAFAGDPLAKDEEDDDDDGADWGKETGNGLTTALGVNFAAFSVKYKSQYC